MADDNQGEQGSQEGTPVKFSQRAKVAAKKRGRADVAKDDDGNIRLTEYIEKQEQLDHDQLALDSEGKFGQVLT